MEVWDPSTGLVVKQSALLPPETGTYTLYDSQLVATKGGSELLLYGGNLGNTPQDGIWKYTIATQKWEPVGKMVQKRAGHLVIPLSSFTCP